MKTSPKAATAAMLQDFFEDARGARVVPLVFVSGAVIESLVPGFNDTRLRNLTEHFPKPKDGHYDLVATLAGLVIWLEKRLEDRSGLAGQFASMKDFCAQTRFPKAMLDFAITKGCKCRDAAGRIDLAPVLEYFEPLFEKIFGGGGKHIEGIEEFDDLDLDAQRAALAKEQTRKEARLNAEAEKVVHSRDEVEELCREQILAPLKNALTALLKKFLRFKASQPGIGHEILEADLPKVLALLAESLPATAALVAERPPMAMNNISDGEGI